MLMIYYQEVIILLNKNKKATNYWLLLLLSFVYDSNLKRLNDPVVTLNSPKFLLYQGI